VSVQIAPVTSSTIVVAVDVGKTSALFSVTDAARHRLVEPAEFAMTGSDLSAAAARAGALVPPSGQVKVGVEAAGHYHRPVLDYRWPDGWEVLELNPAQVAERRHVQGRPFASTAARTTQDNPHRGCIRQRGRQAPTLHHASPPAARPTPHTPGCRPATAAQPLDTTHSQLGLLRAQSSAHRVARGVNTWSVWVLGPYRGLTSPQVCRILFEPRRFHPGTIGSGSRRPLIGSQSRSNWFQRPSTAAHLTNYRRPSLLSSEALHQLANAL
jgi:hypothetical protein